jgi:hypothetical protein
MMDKDMSGNDIACGGQKFCKVRLASAASMLH